MGLKIFQLFQQIFFNTLIIEELEYKRKQEKNSRSHAATAQKYKGNKKVATESLRRPPEKNV